MASASKHSLEVVLGAGGRGGGRKILKKGGERKNRLVAGEGYSDTAEVRGGRLKVGYIDRAQTTCSVGPVADCTRQCVLGPLVTPRSPQGREEELAQAGTALRQL